MIHMTFIINQNGPQEKPMRFKTIAAFALSLVPLFSLTLTSAKAQSSFERSFVPKAKLSDRIWTKHDKASTITVDHAAWNAFLSKYVRTDGRGINRVRYGGVTSADKSALNGYLKDLQAVDVTKLNRNEQFAFWVNLYNATTVSIALQNYPIKSIRDVKKSVVDLVGPFNDKVAKVNGKTLTLNTIESGIVRPIWKDPRLHYVFNCAAVTCPNLGKKAYQGAKLEQQLNSAARSYVNDPRGVKVDGDKITASKIYFWYEGDFGGNEKAILSHLAKYANADLKAKLKGKTSIQKYAYDWTLNDAR